MGRFRTYLSALYLSVLILALPTVSHADQILNFEGYSQGTLFTTQCAGVDFSGAMVLKAPDGLSPQFPPHSGVDVLFNPFGPMSITFTDPVQFFQAYFTFNDGLTIQAFDSSNDLLDTFTSPCSANFVGAGTSCLPNELGKVTGTDIASVLITGGLGNNFALDDARFSSPGVVGSPIPEPASLALVGSGLLGLLGVARRRLAI